MSIDDLSMGEAGNSEVAQTEEARVVSGRVTTPPPEELTGSQAQIQGVMRAFSGRVRYCYEKELKKNPNLEGRVELEWSIEEGRAWAITVAGNNTGSEDLADCVSTALGRIDFPEGLELDVRYPFLFRPQH